MQHTPQEDYKWNDPIDAVIQKPKNSSWLMLTSGWQQTNKEADFHALPCYCVNFDDITVLAFITFLVRLPIMFLTPAMRTDYALFKKWKHLLIK
jgi:hypothetical protein